MGNTEYLRTTTITKRVSGVTVSVMRTGEGEYAAHTVQLTQDSKVIEVFPETLAAIAKAARDMVKLLDVDDGE